MKCLQVYTQLKRTGCNAKNEVQCNDDLDTEHTCSDIQKQYQKNAVCDPDSGTVDTKSKFDIFNILLYTTGYRFS